MIKIFFTVLFLAIGASIYAQDMTIQPTKEIVNINGSSYYLHTVEPKQTMYSICRLYGVTMDDVLKVNSKSDASLNIGEVLRIPVIKNFDTPNTQSLVVSEIKTPQKGEDQQQISQEIEDQQQTPKKVEDQQQNPSKKVPTAIPVSTKKVQIQQTSSHKNVKKEVSLQDETYNYMVKEGETLYAISTRYDLKVRQVLKYNKKYEKQPMYAGDIVKIPVTKQNIDKLRADQKSRAPMLVDQQMEDENARMLSMNDLYKAVDSLKNTPIVQEATVEAIQSVEEVYHSNFLDTSANNELNVALIMPFKINEMYSALNSNKLKKSEIQFICFYEGVLLAIDSLQKTGYKINLYVYDTERRKDKLLSITKKLNEIHPHLILGPVYASEYKVVAESIEDKTIPMIYPLSAKGENLNSYTGFVQVNPSTEKIVNEMTTWVANRTDSVNVILLCLDETSKNNDRQLRDALTKSLTHLNNVAQYKWGLPVRNNIRKNADGEEENDDPFQFILKPTCENIIFVPTTQEGEVIKVLSGLAAYSSMYKISVIGFEEWQRFENVEHDLYYSLNIHLFTYNYVNYENSWVRYFSSKYRKYFEAEPDQIVFKAYELSLYFMEMALKHKSAVLNAICQTKINANTSRFDFQKEGNTVKIENNGLYIVNYSRYNRVIVTNWERPKVVEPIPVLENENIEVSPDSNNDIMW